MAYRTLVCEACGEKLKLHERLANANPPAGAWHASCPKKKIRTLPRYLPVPPPEED